MKRISKYLYFYLLINNIQSQIIITNSNMPSANDTIRYSIASPTAIGNYTNTGANFNWNYGSIVPNNQNIKAYKHSLTTPYGFFFLPPKYGEKLQDTIKMPINIPGIPTITDIFNFYLKTSTLYAIEGIGIKLSGIPVPNFFSDQDELYTFPLKYNNRDSTTFKFSTFSNTLIPFIYIKQGYRITHADGWGTITTPYGTANCLRVVTTQYSYDTLRGSLTVLGIATPVKIGFRNNQRSYQWLTLGEKIPYLEVIGTVINNSFIPSEVRYRDAKRNFVSIKEEANFALSVFPNPTSQILSVILHQNSEAPSATFFDNQGKCVLKTNLNDYSQTININQIDVSNLPKGIYSLCLSTKNGQQTIKVLIN